MGKKTIPVAPKLMTSSRTRHTDYLSFEERENNEVQEMKANQFKARPMPKFVRDSAPLKEQVSGTTKAFTNASLKKFEAIKHQKESFQPKKIAIEPFKAQKVNRKMFTEILGVPEKHKAQTTEPKPFHFKTDMLAENAAMDVLMQKKKKDEEINKLRNYRFTAAPVPDFPSPVKVQKTKTPITFRPFHLETEERGKAQDRNFVMKLEEQLLSEKKQRIFIATPAPANKTPFMPVIDSSSRPPLVTEPFTFATAARCFSEDQRLEDERNKKRRQEEEEAKKPRLFHARPLPDLAHPNFVPQTGDSPLIEPVAPELRTMQRAQEREKFDKEMEKRMEEKKKKESQKAAEELKEYRKQLIFHAQPINAGIDNTALPPRQPSLVTEPITPFVLKRTMGSYKDAWMMDQTETPISSSTAQEMQDDDDETAQEMSEVPAQPAAAPEAPFETPAHLRGMGRETIMEHQMLNMLHHAAVKVQETPTDSFERFFQAKEQMSGE